MEDIAKLSSEPTVCQDPDDLVGAQYILMGTYPLTWTELDGTQSRQVRHLFYSPLAFQRGVRCVAILGGVLFPSYYRPQANDVF